MTGTTIQLQRRTATAAKVPVVSDFNGGLGQLILNTTDGKLYMLKSVSGVQSVVDFQAVIAAAGAALAPVQSVNGGTGAVSITLAGLAGSQGTSVVYAGPTSGSATPTWRQLGVSDITGAAPLASPVFSGESHFSNGTYADPQSGTSRSVKIGGLGLAVSGGTYTDILQVSNYISLTGNQYVANNYTINFYDTSGTTTYLGMNTGNGFFLNATNASGAGQTVLTVATRTAVNTTTFLQPVVFNTTTSFNNLISAYGLYVNNVVNVTSQGFWVGWNRSNGNGETNFINQKGGGTGGFTWGESTTSNVLTQTMSLSPSGVLSISGLLLGSTNASSVTDLSKHISLYSTTTGINVTSSRLNLVAPSGSGHYLVVNGADIAKFTSTGLSITSTLSLTLGNTTLSTNQIASNSFQIANASQQVSYQADGCSPLATNFHFASWNGIGFGHTSGASGNSILPFNTVNSVFINGRTGDINAYGNLLIHGESHQIGSLYMLDYASGRGTGNALALDVCRPDVGASWNIQYATLVSLTKGGDSGFAVNDWLIDTYNNTYQVTAVNGSGVITSLIMTKKYHYYGGSAPSTSLTLTILSGSGVASTNAVIVTVSWSGRSQIEIGVTSGLPVYVSSLIPTTSTVPPVGVYLPSSGVLGFATNTLERIRINTSGNVGINQTNPAYLLDVNGTLNATGAATLGSTLTVSGTITGASVSLSGTLAVTGAFTGSAGSFTTLSVSSRGTLANLTVSSVSNLAYVTVGSTGANLGGSSGSAINTAYGLANSASSLFAWNFTNGSGELDLFVNRAGGSTGGFNIYDFPNISPYTPALLMSLNGAGNMQVTGGIDNTIIGGNTPANGTFSNLFSSYSNVSLGYFTTLYSTTISALNTVGVNNTISGGLYFASPATTAGQFNVNIYGNTNGLGFSCATYFYSGVSFSYTTASSPTDLSHHIALYSNIYGFSITTNRLNIVVPGGASVYCNVNGVDMTQVNSSGLYVNGVISALTGTINGNNILTTASGTEYQSNKGVANGYAGLDGSGKVPTSQLPSSILGAMNYQGGWNASTNSPTLTSGSGTKGWFYTVTTAGTTTVDGISSWNVGDQIAFNGSNWQKFDGVSSEVISVAGRTGAVSLAVADVAGALSTSAAASTYLPLTGGSLTGAVFITDSSTSDAAALTISATSDSNGVNLRMIGPGSTTPVKTIRVVNGQLQFVNSAYSAVILTMNDGGDLYVTGNVTSTAGTLISTAAIPATANNLLGTSGTAGAASAIAVGNGLSLSGSTLTFASSPTAYGQWLFTGVNTGVGDPDPGVYRAIKVEQNGIAVLGGTKTDTLNVTGSATVNGGTVVTSSNYNSYVPSFSGSGATGTWGINVSGTASNISSYSINQNLATNSTPTFLSLIVQAGAITFTTGSTVQLAKFDFSSSNNTFLGIYGFQFNNTANWTGSSVRIQAQVDISPMGYIEFNGIGNAGGVSMFGTTGAGLAITSSGAGSFSNSLSVGSSFSAGASSVSSLTINGNTAVAVVPQSSIGWDAVGVDLNSLTHVFETRFTASQASSAANVPAGVGWASFYICLGGGDTTNRQWQMLADNYNNIWSRTNVAGWNSWTQLVTSSTISAMTSAPTIAALRSSTNTTIPATNVWVSGYYSACDGGEGEFVWNSSDTTSSDNGGTIIVDASGRRWHRQMSSAEVIHVAWFGLSASQSGSTNSGAVNNALAALPVHGGVLEFPTGVITLSTAISYTVSSSVYFFSLTLRGQGISSTYLGWPVSDAFDITFNDPSHTLHVRDMCIGTGSNGGYNGIRVVQNGTGGAAPGCDFTNIALQGFPTQSGGYWTWGIYTSGLSNVDYTGVLVQGLNTGGGVFVQGAPSTGFQYSIVHNFMNCNFNGLSYGFLYGDYLQGVSFTQCNFNGYTGAVAILVQSGAVGSLAQLTASNCQFGGHGNQIVVASSIGGMLFSNNLIFMLNASTGVLVQSGCTVNNSTFTGNSFSNADASVDGSGIYFADGSSSWGNIISGNNFYRCTTGVYLGTSTYSNVVSSNSFPSVTTPITDNGSGNTTSSTSTLSATGTGGTISISPPTTSNTTAQIYNSASTGGISLLCGTGGVVVGSNAGFSVTNANGVITLAPPTSSGGSFTLGTTTGGLSISCATTFTQSINITGSAMGLSIGPASTGSTNAQFYNNAASGGITLLCGTGGVVVGSSAGLSVSNGNGALTIAPPTTSGGSITISTTASGGVSITTPINITGSAMNLSIGPASSGSTNAQFYNNASAGSISLICGTGGISLSSNAGVSINNGNGSLIVTPPTSSGAAVTISTGGSVLSVTCVTKFGSYVQFPSMTTTTKNGLTGMGAGATVFDSTLGRLSTYNGSSWS